MEKYLSRRTCLVALMKSAKRRVLDLQEEEARRISRADLLDAEVLALSKSGKFDVEFPSLLNGGDYRVRPRGWVGQIPIGDTLLVRVSPKVPVGNLFRMLETAYNLRSFRLFDDEVDSADLEDVYERIVSVLARRVLDRARKGLFRDYVSEADALPYLRGRSDLVATALNSMRGVPLIPCTYQEHSPDIEDNRILLWTLQQVRRQAIRQDKVRIELDRARRALAGAVSLTQCSGRDCVRRFYHRLNADYSPLHGLCRFILEQTGPDIEPGDRTFVAFEVNMPQLFQSFVAEWLRANAPAGVSVRCQHHARLEANFGMNIHIDILLCDERTQQPLAVLDTKYKASDRPTDADIYQIAFYARELRVGRALLVYPSALAPFRIDHGDEIVLESMHFDIGTHSPDLAGATFLEALKERLA